MIQHDVYIYVYIVYVCYKIWIKCGAYLYIYICK